MDQLEWYARWMDLVNAVLTHLSEYNEVPLDKTTSFISALALRSGHQVWSENDLKLVVPGTKDPVSLVDAFKSLPVKSVHAWSDLVPFFRPSELVLLLSTLTWTQAVDDLFIALSTPISTEKMYTYGQIVRLSPEEETVFLDALDFDNKTKRDLPKDKRPRLLRILEMRGQLKEAPDAIATTETRSTPINVPLRPIVQNARSFDEGSGDDVTQDILQSMALQLLDKNQDPFNDVILNAIRATKKRIRKDRHCCSRIQCEGCARQEQPLGIKDERSGLGFLPLLRLLISGEAEELVVYSRAEIDDQEGRSLTFRYQGGAFELVAGQGPVLEKGVIREMAPLFLGWTTGTVVFVRHTETLQPEFEDVFKYASKVPIRYNGRWINTRFQSMTSIVEILREPTFTAIVDYGEGMNRQTLENFLLAPLKRHASLFSKGAKPSFIASREDEAFFFKVLVGDRVISSTPLPLTPDQRLLFDRGWDMVLVLPPDFPLRKGGTTLDWDAVRDHLQLQMAFIHALSSLYSASVGPDVPRASLALLELGYRLFSESILSSVDLGDLLYVLDRGARSHMPWRAFIRVPWTVLPLFMSDPRFIGSLEETDEDALESVFARSDANLFKDRPVIFFSPQRDRYPDFPYVTTAGSRRLLFLDKTLLDEMAKRSKNPARDFAYALASAYPEYQLVPAQTPFFSILEDALPNNIIQKRSPTQLQTVFNSLLYGLQYTYEIASLFKEENVATAPVDLDALQKMAVLDASMDCLLDYLRSLPQSPYADNLSLERKTPLVWLPLKETFMYEALAPSIPLWAELTIDELNQWDKPPFLLNMPPACFMYPHGQAAQDLYELQLLYLMQTEAVQVEAQLDAWRQAGNTPHLRRLLLQAQWMDDKKDDFVTAFTHLLSIHLKATSKKKPSHVDQDRERLLEEREKGEGNVYVAKTSLNTLACNSQLVDALRDRSTDQFVTVLEANNQYAIEGKTQNERSMTEWVNVTSRQLTVHETALALLQWASMLSQQGNVQVRVHLGPPPFKLTECEIIVEGAASFLQVIQATYPFHPLYRYGGDKHWFGVFHSSIVDLRATCVVEEDKRTYTWSDTPRFEKGKLVDIERLWLIGPSAEMDNGARVVFTLRDEYSELLDALMTYLPIYRSASLNDVTLTEEGQAVSLGDAGALLLKTGMPSMVAMDADGVMLPLMTLKNYLRGIPSAPLSKWTETDVLLTQIFEGEQSMAQVSSILHELMSFGHRYQRLDTVYDVLYYVSLLKYEMTRSPWMLPPIKTSYAANKQTISLANALAQYGYGGDSLVTLSNSDKPNPEDELRLNVLRLWVEAQDENRELDDLIYAYNPFEEDTDALGDRLPAGQRIVLQKPGTYEPRTLLTGDDEERYRIRFYATFIKAYLKTVPLVLTDIQEIPSPDVALREGMLWKDITSKTITLPARIWAPSYRVANEMELVALVSAHGWVRVGRIIGPEVNAFLPRVLFRYLEERDVKGLEKTTPLKLYKDVLAHGMVQTWARILFELE